MELPSPVVDAGADKVGEHLVPVGGAHQLAHGQAHLPAVVGGQDVAEVAGGHHHVHGLPQGEGALFRQPEVGVEVVDNLGQQPPPVDGVGAGEQQPVPGQQLLHLPIGEDALDRGLGVVEVPLNGADHHVAAFLGGHLPLLHGADTILGVEHGDPGPRHVLEALQGGFPRVPRGGHQNQGLFPGLGLLQRHGEEVRQDLQGHVLKGAGRPVPQLQQVFVLPFRRQGGELHRLAAAEFLRPVGVFHARGDLLFRKVRQKQPEDLPGQLLVGQAGELRETVLQPGKLPGDEQPSLLRDPLGDDLGGGLLLGGVSGATIVHVFHLRFLRSCSPGGTFGNYYTLLWPICQRLLAWAKNLAALP